ncbi:MAG: ABC-F family ATP-binding cassette domain-containing protein [Rhizobium sp.]|nr:ABC-F family ATP-binding cassette domain-containing protein [Rhizobium sp.]
MSAAITLSHLTWSTPDGRPLFSDCDLTFTAERAGLVGRNGVGKTTLLRLIARDLVPHAGTVASSGTVGWLRQSLAPAPQDTIADLFDARDALALLRSAEAGHATAEDLALADWTLEARIEKALDAMGVDAGPATPLVSLSGGQRTRAALAALLFDEPDFLLLDEPTNNLDREGRQRVIDLLARWPKGAVVVSHDRELLDTMDAIVEITSLGVTRYGGNWSHYRERKALELAASRKDFDDAERRLEELASRARETEERKARKDRVGKKKALKGDMPRILAGGLKMRSEATSGNNARLAEDRRSEARMAADAARGRIEVLQPLSVTLASTGLPAGRTVLEVTDASAGYVADAPVLRHLSFSVTGPERVAIRGPNGCGKTTLLQLITGGLPALSGRVSLRVPFALLDQQVRLLDPSTSILANFRRLNPDADENTSRAALARFMYRADAALQTVGELSGGQRLRAGLACVVGGSAPPPLLILDEPTNHLDIDAIEAVEAGLRAYDGALIVVSHDAAFLKAIGITRSLTLPVATDPAL